MRRTLTNTEFLLALLVTLVVIFGLSLAAAALGLPFWIAVPVFAVLGAGGMFAFLARGLSSRDRAGR